MPKQTKMHKIAREVNKIIGNKTPIEVSHLITFSSISKTFMDQYKIWDGNFKTFYAPTLDEVFEKFKESRGISNVSTI